MITDKSKCLIGHHTKLMALKCSKRIFLVIPIYLGVKKPTLEQEKYDSGQSYR